MHHLARMSLHRRALTALVTAAIALAGVFGLVSLRQELIPSINFPAAIVVTSYPGASPAVVEDRVTSTIEQAVAGVDGIEELTSTAANSVSTTTVLFTYGTDMPTALADLRSGVESVRSQLPEDADPQVIAGSIDDLPIVQLAAAGGSGDEALTAAVRDIVVPELEDLDGVRSVTVSGQSERLIEIDVDIEALLAVGLTPDVVLSVLEDYGIQLPTGTITDGEQTLSVQVGTPITSVAELEQIPLTASTTDPGGSIVLSEVAEVVDTVAAATTISRLDGATSLAIAITKTPDGNVVEVSQEIEASLADLGDRLQAADVQVAVVFDQAPFITESIEGLATEGGLGLVFAVLVILAFLMSWRSTLISAVSIPLSLLAAFIVMWGTGYTLNLLTLAALTISVGRVVDDAIVVIENINRHLSYGEERMTAIQGAVKEVAGAITASTLATVAVFAPIGFVGGFVGELFRPFALTMAIGMVASLFVALTIIPVLAFWFVKAHGAADVDEAARVRADAEVRERRGLWQRGYLPVLGAALRRPVVTLLVAVGVLAGTAAMVPLLQTNLLGDSGQNTLTVTQTFRPGTSLAAQDDAAVLVEDELAQIPAVQTVQSSIGGGGLAALLGGGGGYEASFALTLDADADAVAAQEDIRQALAPLRTGVVTEITVVGGDAGLAASTVDLIVTGDDADDLAEAAEMVRTAVEDADGASQVTSTSAQAQPVLQVSVDREAAAAAGLTEAEVAAVVAAAMNDPAVGTLDIDGEEVDVVALLSEPPVTVDQLEQLLLTAATPPVPLSEIATIEEVDAPASITRLDGRRTVTVSVTPSGTDLGALSSDLTTRIDALTLPVGTDVTIGGAAADQQEAFADLAIALVLAIAIVYIVLVATFNSLVQPLILLVSVPFAATGSLLGLLLTGTPLGVPALIGFLMLVGVVVSNAIVLIDLINQYRARGRDLLDAVTEGARKRLRPIVMTAAATIFALLPMAFGLTGGGAFISGPLAIVVIGGLLSSTLLTLIVVPVLYTLGQRRTLREQLRARSDADREGAALHAAPEATSDATPGPGSSSAPASSAAAQVDAEQVDQERPEQGRHRAEDRGQDPSAPDADRPAGSTLGQVPAGADPADGPEHPRHP